jgi:hypothetical protein
MDEVAPDSRGLADQPADGDQLELFPRIKYSVTPLRGRRMPLDAFMNQRARDGLIGPPVPPPAA